MSLPERDIRILVDQISALDALVADQSMGDTTSAAKTVLEIFRKLNDIVHSGILDDAADKANLAHAQAHLETIRRLLVANSWEGRPLLPQARAEIRAVISRNIDKRRN